MKKLIILFVIFFVTNTDSLENQRFQRLYGTVLKKKRVKVNLDIPDLKEKKIRIKECNLLLQLKTKKIVLNVKPDRNCGFYHKGQKIWIIAKKTNLEDELKTFGTKKLNVFEGVLESPRPVNQNVLKANFLKVKDKNLKSLAKHHKKFALMVEGAFQKRVKDEEVLYIKNFNDYYYTVVSNLNSDGYTLNHQYWNNRGKVFDYNFMPKYDVGDNNYHQAVFTRLSKYQEDLFELDPNERFVLEKAIRKHLEKKGYKKAKKGKMHGLKVRTDGQRVLLKVSHNKKTKTYQLEEDEQWGKCKDIKIKKYWSGKEGMIATVAMPRRNALTIGCSYIIKLVKIVQTKKITHVFYDGKKIEEY